MKKLISLVALMTVLVGCTTKTPTNTATYGSEGGIGEETLITEETGKLARDSALLAAAPKYYIGSAYKVETVQYVPAEDLTYDQTGMAGIVPAELNGTKTSNGEVFDVNQMFATSKTLPLPTIARVTNLENGQSVIVRVNNRGPFVNTRLMDLSPAAAEKIGIKGQAKVQIQVLAEESTIVKNATLGITEPAEPTEPTEAQPTAVSSTGPYTVQLAAFYSEDSANALASKMRTYGDTVVVKEGDMYKVRIVDLDAAKARSTIDALRSGEGMAPGLLKNGRWINADSI